MGKKTKRNNSRSHQARKNVVKTLSISLSPKSPSVNAEISSFDKKISLKDHDSKESKKKTSFSDDIMSSLDKKLSRASENVDNQPSPEKSSISTTFDVMPDFSQIHKIKPLDFEYTIDEVSANFNSTATPITVRSPINGFSSPQTTDSDRNKLSKNSASPTEPEDYKRFSIIKSNTFSAISDKSIPELQKSKTPDLKIKTDIQNLSSESKKKVFTRFLRRGYKWKDKFSKDQSNPVDVYEFIKSPEDVSPKFILERNKKSSSPSISYSTSSSITDDLPILKLASVDPHISLGLSKNKPLGISLSHPRNQRASSAPKDEDGNKISYHNSNSSIKESSEYFDSEAAFSWSNSMSNKDNSGSFEPFQKNGKQGIIDKIKKMKIGSGSNSLSPSTQNSSDSNQSLKNNLEDLNNSHIIPKNNRDAFMFSNRSSMLPKSLLNSSDFYNLYEQPSKENPPFSDQIFVSKDELPTGQNSATHSHSPKIITDVFNLNHKNNLSESTPNFLKIKHSTSNPLESYSHSKQIKSKPNFNTELLKNDTLQNNSPKNLIIKNGPSHDLISSADTHKPKFVKENVSLNDTVKKSSLDLDFKSSDPKFEDVSTFTFSFEKTIDKTPLDEPLNVSNATPTKPNSPPYKQALEYRENELKRLYAFSGCLDSWEYAIPLDNYSILEINGSQMNPFTEKSKGKGGNDKGGAISNWKSGFLDVFSKSRAKSFIVGDSGKQSSGNVDSFNRSLNTVGQRSRMKSMLTSETSSGYSKSESANNLDSSNRSVPYIINSGHNVSSSLNLDNSHSPKSSKFSLTSQNSPALSGLVPEPDAKIDIQHIQEISPSTFCEANYSFDRKALLDSKESIFGLPLHEAVKKSQLVPNIKLPAVVIRCIEYLELHGLTEVGIYRVSGSYRTVNILKSMFTPGRDIDFKLLHLDIHSISTLLKMYLRELPESIFTDSLLGDFIDLDNNYPPSTDPKTNRSEPSNLNFGQGLHRDEFSSDFSNSVADLSSNGPTSPLSSVGTKSDFKSKSLKESSKKKSKYTTFKNIDEWITELKKLISLLPLENQALLGWMFCHLSRVAYHSKENKMTLSNLGLIFCTTLEIRPHTFFELVKSSDRLFDSLTFTQDQNPHRLSNSFTFPGISKTTIVEPPTNDKKQNSAPLKPLKTHTKSRSNVEQKNFSSEKNVMDLADLLLVKKIINSKNEAIGFSRWVVSGKLSWLKIISSGFLNGVMDDINFKVGRNSNRLESFSKSISLPGKPDDENLRETGADKNLTSVPLLDDFNLKGNLNMLSSLGAGYATQYRRKSGESTRNQVSVADKILQWELNTVSTSPKSRNKKLEQSMPSIVRKRSSMFNGLDDFRSLGKNNGKKVLNTGRKNRSENFLSSSTPSLGIPIDDGYLDTNIGSGSDEVETDLMNYSMSESSQRANKPKSTSDLKNNSNSFDPDSDFSEDNFISRTIGAFENMSKSESPPQQESEKSSSKDLKEFDNTQDIVQNEHETSDPIENISSSESAKFVKRPKSMEVNASTDFDFDSESDLEEDESCFGNDGEFNTKKNVYSKFNVSSISRKPLGSPPSKGQKNGSDKDLRLMFDSVDSIEKTNKLTKLYKHRSDPVNSVTIGSDLRKLLSFDAYSEISGDKIYGDDSVDLGIDILSSSESFSTPERKQRIFKRKSKTTSPRSNVIILINNKEYSVESEDSNGSNNFSLGFLRATSEDFAV
ncbi:putative Rho-type GTPase-activating protein 2 [Smittium mucronatum]|uniref:Putative Rho-type GTPase-activating protein 2 n=1 Tax=Smittium mucronatum TaxID=133383 RepID=A0A1R0GUV1_9FUNG|nr:putative Rho-type GTPase-activating protein 2 [Smittium mucronatum]